MLEASEFLLDINRNGYKLPFVNTPPSFRFDNNRSAISHSEFVTGAITDLLEKNLIVESDAPYTVNPPSVAIQSSGKKRLILDLSFVNTFLWKSTIKFDDWKDALSYFQKGDFCNSFDHKSGYHQ